MKLLRCLCLPGCVSKDYAWHDNCCHRRLRQLPTLLRIADMDRRRILRLPSGSALSAHRAIFGGG